MAEHNEFGKEGEEEAAAYLIDKGYSIRHRNWHCGKKELDIVAEYRNSMTEPARRLFPIRRTGRISCSLRAGTTSCDMMSSCLSMHSDRTQQQFLRLSVGTGVLDDG